MRNCLLRFALAVGQLDLRAGDPEPLLEQLDEGGVGAAIFRRGGDGDLQGTAVFAEDGVLAGAGLGTHSKQ